MRQSEKRFNSPMVKNTLDNWEVALVKAFQRDTGKNDQDMLAYFTRPNRTINHRLIGKI